MPDRDQLADLLDSWRIALQAERKSPKTVKIYTEGVRLWLRWCDQTGTEPVIDRRTVGAWTAHLLDTGAAAATASARQFGVRRFSAWLAAEEEIERDELLGLKPPKLDVQAVPSLNGDELAALLKACEGKGFGERRDEAIVRLICETGARAEEVLSLTVDDVDLTRGAALIRRGKGGKARTIPLGPLACRSIDRYLRLRRSHPKAARPALWLGVGGQGFGYSGLYRTLLRRAEAAGIRDFFPHRLRHAFASRWLAAGGSETGLMAVAGWSRREMIDRYSKSTSEARAAEEARKLNLGDL